MGFSYPLFNGRDADECLIINQTETIRLEPSDTVSVFIEENHEIIVDDRSTAPDELLINLPFKEIFKSYNREVLKTNTISNILFKAIE